MTAMTPVQAHDDPPAARLAWAVASHRRATGRLPSLAEVARQLGWSLDQTRQAVAQLQQARQTAPAGKEGAMEGRQRPPGARKADPRRRAAARRALEAANQAPTPSAVAARLRDWEARDARRARLRAIAGRDGPGAARWVAAYRAEHGCGPTWGELGRAMGWPAGRTSELVRIAATGGDGWLHFSEGVERSLDVGPLAGREAAPG